MPNFSTIRLIVRGASQKNLRGGGINPPCQGEGIRSGSGQTRSGYGYLMELEVGRKRGVSGVTSCSKLYHILLSTSAVATEVRSITQMLGLGFGSDKIGKPRIFSTNNRNNAISRLWKPSVQVCPYYSMIQSAKRSREETRTHVSW